MREEVSFCRICNGYCGMILNIGDDERLVSVRGDKSNPMSEGYACIKGLQLPYAYNGQQRVLRPLKRQPDGSYAEIDLERALDEIAEKIAAIIARDGAEAVAVYHGGTVYSNALASEFHTSFMQAIGSTSFFSSVTIDQSAKNIAADRIGTWHAGKDHFHSADVMMIFGGNPLLAIGLFGYDMYNPMKKLKAFKARGGKLIVIDPRRTETAEFADIFLQPKPGEDVTVAAGMLRVILGEGLEDADFCQDYVTQLDALRNAVAPFTLDYVARRADQPVAPLRAAAQTLALARRGFVTSGTGPSMAPRSNLAEHLFQCLDVVCGHFLRAGDKVPNPGLARKREWRAQVVPPGRCWEHSPKSRVRGLGILFGEKFSGAMAQEITTPGPGQIRAMIVDGGNPATSVPDQRRIVEALKSLELLVTIDPEMSTTARISHYVLPPKLNFEHMNVPGILKYETAFMQKPFQQFGAPVLKPPAGSQLVDEWYVYWAIVKRLGMKLVFDGVELDMSEKPEDIDLFRILFRNGNISFDDVVQHPRGHIFEVEAVVEAGEPGANGRFEVAPDDIVGELAAVAAEPLQSVKRHADGRLFDLLMTSRRLRDVFNSTTCRGNAIIEKRQRFNAAYVHPDELAARELAEGDEVVLTSDAGSIPAIVKADATLRRGMVSIAHGWGGLPDEALDYRSHGSCTGLLISTETDCESINHMPRMSAIPVMMAQAPKSF